MITRNPQKKRRRKGKGTDLRIDPANQSLQKKWRPLIDNESLNITRPIDITRRFHVGIAEVLRKLKILGVENVSRTTKLPTEIISRIFRDGNNPDFWPTLKSKGDRKQADPESMGYDGKTKKVRHIQPGKRKTRKKKKSQSGPPPILTPVGGQPGYRIGRQYK